MRTKRLWAFRPVMAALAASALVLAACGDAADDPGDDGDTAAPADDEDASDVEDESDEDEAQEGDDELGEAEFTLTFASYIVEPQPWMQQYLEYTDRITQETNGRVQFENFFGESLLGFAEIMPAIGDGRVDMGFTSPQANPDIYPMTSIVSVPYGTPSVPAAARAMDEAYAGANEEFRSEWDESNVRPLKFQPVGTNVLGAPEPLSSVADLSGMRVRSSGYGVQAFDLLGADPIAMSSAEIYEAMQTGVIDAWANFTLENAQPFNLHEVTPYFHDIGLGSSGIVVTAMNLDTWESLPEDIQQVFIDVSQEYTLGLGDFLQSMDVESCAFLNEVDANAVVWSDDAIQEASDMLLDPVAAGYIGDVDAAGRDGQAWWDYYQSYMDGDDGSYGTYDGSVAGCDAG